MWLHCDAPQLHEAVSYVLANPGKQLRSQLTRAACALFTGEATEASSTLGTAIEWLHCYSLVHDDLPAMDNDDMRRGKPTVHKAYDEATAILVGDGLQAAAFGLIAGEHRLSADQRVKLIAEISKAVGFGGMVGGQALDMAAENQQLTLEALRHVHRQKTGALIVAALVAGAICGGAQDDDVERLATFGDTIGLAFQVTDDVLDVTQPSEQLGKTAGKDMAANKSTYVSCLGLGGAREEAIRLLDEAKRSLASFGERAQPLLELAQRMVLRQT